MMDTEKYLTKSERKILKSFPGLTQAELDAANDLFCHYIVYETVKGGRRIWTSCCHRDMTVDIPARSESPELREVLYGQHNDVVKCPWCGRTATIKCRGRFRGRKVSFAEGQVVFLKATKNGNLYAQSYWMHKDYKEHPEVYPVYCSSANYYFQPGVATMFYEDYGCWHAQTEQCYMGKAKRVVEPFHGYGLFPKVYPYAVIGIDELDKSFARYCNYKSFHLYDDPDAFGTYDDLMRFLSIACVYPRQLEMLNKAGQLTLINDLMWQGKKNAAVFKWSETDPRKAFGMDGQELKHYLAYKDALGLLEIRRALNCNVERANSWFDDCVGFYHADEVISFKKTAEKHGLGADELRKYLTRFTGPRCHGQGFFTVKAAYQLWLDYLANAETAGFDITQRNVLLPRDLYTAHDNTMTRVQKINEAKNKKKAAEQRRKAKKRAKELDARYGFETEHYFIRAPKSAEEIVSEGRSLHHCVGGFADRHCEGEVTILFLREKAHPMTPLCTIQVDGDRLVQIHGYDDERQKGSVKPALRFAEIYEPWARWLKAGQPRKKDGTPRVPKNKERKTA